MSFTVAIDGPAAAGKGTIARAVAAHFGFAHLDTGLLYRAVGRRVLAGEVPVDAAQELAPGDLANPDALRSAAIADAASRVAVIPEVRAALVDFQRAFAARTGGAVLDGRDIGTVICPEAAVKLFVTASAEVRALRRLNELRAAGHDTDFETVLADVRLRDARDAERAIAPMIAAERAVILDTSKMSIAEAVAAAIAVVEARGGAPRGD
ncbi:(d)CMP kinase [Roseicyclus mahoneyensis]|uniref:Cytidylate kinase n=1 Tax=Roseicyclus mahoneyensis TaxID=164332 RepID=A0A316GKT3_9RHOB|nr:d(CMP) kinase [Roseicyclus mahoneyensis]PWK60808.1 cytidylate kinase [Roseicyclus mahoneyensis]